MARKSKVQQMAEIEERAARDNNAAALLRPGMHVENDVFGVLVLGERLPKQEDTFWDMYDVIFDEFFGGILHRNMHHTWSSASVVAAFKA